MWYITNHFVVNMGNDPVVAEIVNGMTEDVAADRLRTVGNDALLVTVPQRISMTGACIENVIYRQRLRRIIDGDEVSLAKGIKVEPLLPFGLARFYPPCLREDAMIRGEAKPIKSAW